MQIRRRPRRKLRAESSPIDSASISPLLRAKSAPKFHTGFHDKQEGQPLFVLMGLSVCVL